MFPKLTLWSTTISLQTIDYLCTGMMSVAKSQTVLPSVCRAARFCFYLLIMFLCDKILGSKYVLCFFTVLEVRMIASFSGLRNLSRVY